MFYRKVAKPILFKLDPETAHHLVIRGMKQLGRMPLGPRLLGQIYPMHRSPRLEVSLWGMTFPNPIGLAAGLDKNGEAVPAFSAIGFGFLEVGTVTPLGQPGNDRPRLFRLPEYEALINRMGFNNEGAVHMAANLSRIRQRPIPVAVNIGKNKTTPNDEAEADYVACIRELYDHADWFVVNISSPNTPGLRDLQTDGLGRLLRAVMEEMASQQERRGGPPKPVAVKLAPDMEPWQLEEAIGRILEHGVSAVIATNTTVGRTGIDHPHAAQTGGLSGRPLGDRSTEMVRSIYRLTGGKLPIIGCGGIFTAEDAYAKIRAGASLVELYTSLIYRGPGLLAEICRGLDRLLEQDGYTHVSQAVGVDA